MTILNYLFLLLIEPIKLMIEVIYFHAYKITGNCALAIVFLSLAVNLLVLPLYNRADDLQLKAKAKEDEVRPMAAHIKKVFKGDEKVMMLQAFYREMGYSPINTLKSAVSLILQIPFFMAAYYFLSELKMLHGISMGPIADLGKPDALLTFGNMNINLLPILMTGINVISSFIYAGKQSVKDKLKLIGMALVFLVLLYGSPSGLVFYWTLNNVFSLVKNIILCIRKRSPEDTVKNTNKPDKITNAIFLISCGILAILTGLMIPADVVSQNPAELINSYGTDLHSPVLYLVSSVMIAVGTFLIWIPLFYYLLKEKAKKIISVILATMAAVGAINYYVFNKNFGFLTKKIIYEQKMEFSVKDMILNLLADLVLAGLVVFVCIRKKKLVRNGVAILLAGVIFLASLPCIATAVFSAGYNHSYHNSPEDIKISMTTEGQNVVVIMMDRMISAYIPYIFNERPDVAAQFDGFTYYPNTISFGQYTNFGSPALYGGYEYTPAAINARSDEMLVDKHNESLCVMPQIFSDNGWNVTVGDPSYANYNWIPDVSIYDYNENIKAYQMAGVLNSRSQILVDCGEDFETRLNRNLFCYGVMKILPYVLQPMAYSEGAYGYMNFAYDGYVDASYQGNSLHTQSGYMESFIQEKTVLDNLDDMLEITSDPTNCFFMLANGTTHEPTLLTEPDYTPAVFVDNTEYDNAHEDRFTVNGVTMHMDTSYLTYAAYECNMAACIALGEWFDYLRENGLYDNTRIIIVSDHGDERLTQFDDLLVEDLRFNAQSVNPILMVKDFGSMGFTVSDVFMTNADTPLIAFEGLVEDPVNPFTGNPMTGTDKTEDQLIYISDNLNTLENSGTQFEDPDGYWLTVHDDIRDDDNWALYDGAPY
ncbi:MAG: YidC/Oxa1 family membrane protein insertase [Saccharofermentans sp.]|nr:YidC/Oxa1 family membrane protein insertase [Saccharofermentans sp.]